MNSLFLWICCLVFAGMISCTPYLTMPPAIPVPAPDQGKDLTIQAQAGFRNLYDSKNGLKNIVVNATLKRKYHAFAHWNNFNNGSGEYFNGDSRTDERTVENNQKLMMAGGGYSQKVLDSRYRMSLLGGIGLGTMVYSNTVQPNRRRSSSPDDTLFHYAMKANNQTLFLIPSFSGVFDQTFLFCFSTRIRSFRFRVRDFKEQGYDGRFQKGEPIYGTDYPYYPLPDFKVTDHRTFFLLEPALTVRLPVSFVYFQVQAMYVWNLGPYPLATKPYRLEFSLGFQFPGQKELKW